MLLALHPGLKLEYFRRQNWPDAWIATAQEILENVFEAYTEKYDRAANVTTSSMVSIYSFFPSLVPTSTGYLSHLYQAPESSTAAASSSKVSDDAFATYANISILDDATPKTELTKFLESDREDVTDPLKWWYNHRAQYPVLSHMALDYLSAPGKSVVYFSKPLLMCSLSYLCYNRAGLLARAPSSPLDARCPVFFFYPSIYVPWCLEPC